MHRTTARRLIGAALLLPLALVACSSGGDDSADDQNTAVESDDASVEDVADEETEDVEIDQNYDYEPVDFGTPTEVTAPGTALTFGQPAWVNWTQSGSEETTVVGVSVLDIVTADPSLFDQYSNADEFAGYTPYLVVVQNQWTELPADGTDPSTVDLFPLAADGTDLEYLTGSFSIFGATDECGLRYPEFDAEKMVGLTCFVGLSTDQPVSVIEFNGESYSAIMADPDNAYFDAPITWNG